MKKILSIVAIFIIVFSTFPMFVAQVKADGNDSLSQSYFWQGHGGYVANGVGMWLQGGPYASGDIIVSGIPSGAIIEAVFLYWSTWEEINPPCTSITVNGIPITEELIGTATEIDPLWPAGLWPHTYRGYRADISSIVTGNGIYKVSGFPTGTEYDRQNTMGATIVVIYSLQTAPLVTIVINDGMVALHARPQSYTTTLSGFVAPSSPVAQITYIAGQAEPHWTLDWEYFNGNLLAQNGLDGSDGPLWDTDTYDVSSYISEGDTSATATIAMQNDWIGWVAAIFQVKAPEEWSFAIITDLHIGRGYPDYAGEGHDDRGTTGQDYYLTKRLEIVVKWINENQKDKGIKFLVALGDIADSGEYSELDKAKKILDGLEIPYLPVIGNHDVWAKTESTEEVPVADLYFNTIFDAAFFSQQFEKLGATWWARSEHNDYRYLQNYAFSFRGTTFISLDFVNRNPSPLGLFNAKAILHYESEELLEYWLSGGEPTIIFSHHPMIENIGMAFNDITPIEDIINMAEDSFETKVLANFAGHIHGYYDPSPLKIFSAHSFDNKKDLLDFWKDPTKVISSPIFVDANNNYKEEGFTTPAGIPVVTTEAMMVASNEPTPKSIIRIVRVKGEEIDHNTIEGEFRALNPYFKEIDMSEWRPPWRFVVEFEVYAFTKRFTQERPGIYTIDFGDGTPSESKESKRWDEAVQFDHDYRRGKHYDVTLTVTGWTPEGERIEEKITRRIYVPTLLSIGTFSPVDIAVTDPEGRTISKQENEIPGATYIEVDLNEDGDLDDLVVIQDPLDGNYVVLLIGTATGTYSVTTEFVTPQQTITQTYTGDIMEGKILEYIATVSETDLTTTSPVPPILVDKIFKPDKTSLKRLGAVMSRTNITNTGYLDIDQTTYQDEILDGWAVPDFTKPISVTLFVSGTKYKIPYEELTYVAIENGKYIVQIDFNTGIDLYQYDSTLGQEVYVTTIYAFEPEWIIEIKYPMLPLTNLQLGEYSSTVSIIATSPEGISIKVEDTATLTVTK